MEVFFTLNTQRNKERYQNKGGKIKKTLNVPYVNSVKALSQGVDVEELKKWV